MGNRNPAKLTAIMLIRATFGWPFLYQATRAALSSQVNMVNSATEKLIQLWNHAFVNAHHRQHFY
jgi:hypothetical protein